MTSMIKYLCAAAVAVGTTACAGYPMGFLYNDTTVPHAATRSEVSGAAKSGDLAGEACATGILGIVAWGDASTDAAKKAGKITDVHSTEFKSFSVLGIYTQGCTHVHGK
jgi:hypothetical protein